MFWALYIQGLLLWIKTRKNELPKFPGFNLSLCESKPFPRHHTLSRRLMNEVLSFTEAGKKGLRLIESEATDLMLKRVRSCREKAYVLTSGMSAAAMPARQCGQSVAACLKPTGSGAETKPNTTTLSILHSIPWKGPAITTLSSKGQTLLQRPNIAWDPQFIILLKKKKKKTGQKLRN